MFMSVLFLVISFSGGKKKKTITAFENFSLCPIWYFRLSSALH